MNSILKAIQASLIAQSDMIAMTLIVFMIVIFFIALSFLIATFPVYKPKYIYKILDRQTGKVIEVDKKFYDKCEEQVIKLARSQK